MFRLGQNQLTVVLVAAFTIAACSKPDATTTTTTTGGSAATTATTVAPAQTSTAKVPATTTEYDLSSADPAWRGWVASGPAGAKVMAEGSHGARLATDGLEAFDVTFGDPRSVKDAKAGIEASKALPDTKITYLSEADDNLEWRVDAFGSKSFKFVKNVTVGGKKVSCANDLMGASNEQAFAEQKATCASLHKK